MPRPITEKDIGLKVLYPTASGSETVHKVAVDIVAVHGMGAHPNDTWSKALDGDGNDKKYINWLDDPCMLPAVVPEARIMRYGYRSEWFGDGAVRTKVSTISPKLLRALKRERETCLDRPLIFIAHSYGGLVVLRTLVDAERKKAEWPEIYNSVIGLVFFGTPFRGTHSSFSHGELLQLAEDQFGSPHVSGENLKIMRSGDESLGDLVDMYLDTTGENMPRIACFFEQMVTDVGVILTKDEKHVRLDVPLVDESSGCLDLSASTRKCGLSRTHFDMNKFGTPDEEDFITLGEFIREMIQGPHPMDEDKFLRSLAFDNMDDRKDSIRKASNDTCDWIFEHPEYCSWNNRTNVQRDRALLWIKGKPGTGKSTLMQEIDDRTRTRTAQTDTAVAAFYFNARGKEQLEKTPLGLLRSILHQTLKKDRKALRQFIPEFKENLASKGFVSWSQNRLQQMLLQIVSTSDAQPAIILVDALDECHEDEVRDLIRYFQRLAERASKAGACLNVCFSSRHYPSISIENCPEIVVEDHNSRDITRHVQGMRISERKLLILAPKIIERASGIFLWVTLVLSILETKAKSLDISQLEEELIEIPDTLEDLFKTLVVRKMDRRDQDRLGLLIRLVLFAKTALSAGDLALALALGKDTPPRSIKDWRGSHGLGTRQSCDYHANYGYFEGLIVDLSRGLLEFKSAFRPYGKAKRVQFIHESARVFFLQGTGSTLLFPGLDVENVLGQGHAAVAAICAKSFRITEFQQVLADSRNHEKKAEPLPTHTDSSPHAWPFLGYAEQNVLLHVEIALSHGVDQDQILALLLRSPSPFYSSKFPLGGDNLTEVLLETPSVLFKCIIQGATRCAERLITIDRANLEEKATCRLVLHYSRRAWDHVSSAGGYEGSGGQYLPSETSFPTTPLLTAFDTDNRSMLELLVKRGADLTVRGGLFQDTPLHRACRMGDQELVGLLIGTGASVLSTDDFGRTPLHIVCASISPSYCRSKPLTEISKIAQRWESLWPSADSWIPGADVRLMSILIEHGSSLCFPDLSGTIALNILSPGGQESFSRILDSKALPRSNERGEQVIHQLLQDDMLAHHIQNSLRIDVTSNAKGRTILHYAAQNRCINKLTWFLEHGATVEVADGDGNTPLHIAANEGWSSGIDCLAKYSKDVDMTNVKGETALNIMVGRNCWDAIDSLLSCKPRTDTPDANGDTPLHIAARKGSCGATLSFLANCKTDAKNKKRQTALHSAVTGCPERIHRDDPDCSIRTALRTSFPRCDQTGSPLPSLSEHAKLAKKILTVYILVSAGFDATNDRDENNQTPLDLWTSNRSAQESKVPPHDVVNVEQMDRALKGGINHQLLEDMKQCLGVSALTSKMQSSEALRRISMANYRAPPSPISKSGGPLFDLEAEDFWEWEEEEEEEEGDEEEKEEEEDEEEEGAEEEDDEGTSDSAETEGHQERREDGKEATPMEEGSIPGEKSTFESLVDADSAMSGKFTAHSARFMMMEVLCVFIRHAVFCILVELCFSYWGYTT